MPRIAIQIVLGLAALLIALVAVMFVLQIGPFNSRPSVAAKELPKVTAAVAGTQTKAAETVAKAENKTKDAISNTERRTEGNVAKIRAAAPRVAPADVSDREFFLGVCQSKFYAGSAECRGIRRQP